MKKSRSTLMTVFPLQALVRVPHMNMMLWTNSTGMFCIDNRVARWVRDLPGSPSGFISHTHPPSPPKFKHSQQAQRLDSSSLLDTATDPQPIVRVPIGRWGLELWQCSQNGELHIFPQSLAVYGISKLLLTEMNKCACALWIILCRNPVTWKQPHLLC